MKINLIFFFLIFTFTFGPSLFAESLPMVGIQSELDFSPKPNPPRSTIEQLFIKVLDGNALPSGLEVIQTNNDLSPTEYFLIESDSQNIIAAILYNEAEEKWAVSENSDNSADQHPDFIWSPNSGKKSQSTLAVTAFPYARLQALVDSLLNNSSKSSICLFCP